MVSSVNRRHDPGERLRDRLAVDAEVFGNGGEAKTERPQLLRLRRNSLVGWEGCVEQDRLKRDFAGGSNSLRTCPPSTLIDAKRTPGKPGGFPIPLVTPRYASVLGHLSDSASQPPDSLQSSGDGLRSSAPKCPRPSGRPGASGSAAELREGSSLGNSAAGDV